MHSLNVFIAIVSLANVCLATVYNPHNLNDMTTLVFDLIQMGKIDPDGIMISVDYTTKDEMKAQAAAITRQYPTIKSVETIWGMPEVQNVLYKPSMATLEDQKQSIVVFHQGLSYFTNTILLLGVDNTHYNNPFDMWMLPTLTDRAVKGGGVAKLMAVPRGTTQITRAIQVKYNAPPANCRRDGPCEQPDTANTVAAPSGWDAVEKTAAALPHTTETVYGGKTIDVPQWPDDQVSAAIAESYPDILANTPASNPTSDTSSDTSTADKPTTANDPTEHTNNLNPSEPNADPTKPNIDPNAPVDPSNDPSQPKTQTKPNTPPPKPPRAVRRNLRFMARSSQ